MAVLMDDKPVFNLYSTRLPVNLRLRDGRQALHVAAVTPPIGPGIAPDRGADRDSLGPGGARLFIWLPGEPIGDRRILLNRGADSTVCDGETLLKRVQTSPLLVFSAIFSL